MKNFTIIKEAQQFAENLLVQARENEPKITADLQRIAETISAKTVGLDNKFKTVESLTRKITDTANTNRQTTEKVAETINDVLRYTFVLPFDTYAKSLQETIKGLNEIGYQTPPNRIWNAWKYAGKSRDKGYRGINVTVISSQNQKFELQFYTAESYLLKTETHNLYRELRSETVSEQREIELIAEMKKAAFELKRPEGV